MKKVIIIIILILVVLGILVIKYRDVKSSGTIKIGSISALTGTGAAIGQEERNGALLAVEGINMNEGINGKKIELVAEDLGFDNLKLASAVTSKLITIDKVSAIVGAQWDEPTEVVLPNIEQAGIPMVGADVTNNVEKDKNYEYFFSTWYDNRSGIKKLLSFAKKRNLKDIIIVRPVDGGFWKFTADLFTEYAPDYGVTIIDDIKLSDPFTIDYRTTLTKIKAKAPDAVFIVVTDPTQCPFMKQVKDLSLTIPILGTEASGSYASLGACGDILENLYFSTPIQTNSYKQFEKLYIERFKRTPQFPSAVTAYDAIGIIAKALVETNNAKGKILRDSIAQTKDYKGASLPSITLDKKGFMMTPEDAWDIRTVKNGKFVGVE